jgi:IS605 OrfB family transposase
MITLKIKYKASEEFQSLLKEYRREQSSVVRIAYNMFLEGLNERQIRENLFTYNFDLLDSWFIQSGIRDAQGMYKTILEQQEEDKPLRKVIFGGKHNLKQYLQKKITKEEFKNKRLRPLSVVGEAPQTGNRKFRLDIENNQILFQDKRGKVKHVLNLQPQLRDRLEQLRYIEDLTKERKTPLTVKIDENYVYLTFEPKQKEITSKIENRIFAIDMNPNSIGWSVVDIINENEIRPIETGVIDLKELNEKKTTKKHHETYEISKFLVNTAEHYKCSKFAVEDLSIQSKDHNRGRAYNKLVNNNWIRNKLVDSLKKRCFIAQIKLIEVNPAYTSIIGGVIHSSYPDPISPTFEIARRANFKYQKDMFYPKVPSTDVLNELWKQTLEKSFKDWKELSTWLKNTGQRYRVSLEDFPLKVFRLKSTKSTVTCSYLYV